MAWRRPGGSGSCSMSGRSLVRWTGYRPSSGASVRELGADEEQLRGIARRGRGDRRGAPRRRGRQPAPVGAAVIAEVSEALRDVVHQATPDLGDWVVQHSLVPGRKDRRSRRTRASWPCSPSRSTTTCATGRWSRASPGWCGPRSRSELHYLVTYLGDHDEAQTPPGPGRPGLPHHAHPAAPPTSSRRWRTRSRRSPCAWSHPPPTSATRSGGTRPSRPARRVLPGRRRADAGPGARGRRPGRRAPASSTSECAMTDRDCPRLTLRHRVRLVHASTGAAARRRSAPACCRRRTAGWCDP